MMSRGVNTSLLLGNLGKEPELTYSKTGMAICNFSLAIGQSRKVNDQWQEFTEWVNCTAFGKTAETISTYCTKGSQLYVEGSIKTDKYEKDGAMVYRTGVIVNKICLLGKVSDIKQPASSPPKPAPETEEGVEDDLPF